VPAAELPTDVIEAADAYILAAPTNFSSVTALFKRFAERLAVYGYWPWGKHAPVFRKAKLPKKPAIIISSSGMCEAGRILHHLIHNIEDSKNTILVVGYMAENTLGRKIQEKQPLVKIFGDDYKLNADVRVLNTFSAHADYNDILDYISSLNYKKLKGVYLVHGENKAQENLKSLLEAKNYNTRIVKTGEQYILQN